MSARLDGREPHVGRPIPGRFVEVIGLDRRGARQIGDRPCDPEQAFRAAATRSFELGEDHDPPFRARPQEARLAQSPAGEAAVERAARPVRGDATRGRDPGGDDGRALPGPARERGPSARRAASRSTGRSGRGAGRRRVAGTAPAPASGRRTDDRTSRRSRTGRGSSPRPAGTAPGSWSLARPARWPRGPPPSAGGAPPARRGRTRAARRGTARPGRRGSPRRVTGAGHRRPSRRTTGCGAGRGRAAAGAVRRSVPRRPPTRRRSRSAPRDRRAVAGGPGSSARAGSCPTPGGPISRRP